MKDCVFLGNRAVAWMLLNSISLDSGHRFGFKNQSSSCPSLIWVRLYIKALLPHPG